MGGLLVSYPSFEVGVMGVRANDFAAYKFPKAQERLEELKRGGAKVQRGRERLSRSNQKQHDENCSVM